MFNNSKTISSTISSLKRQTFSDWECVITDDSKDDATYQVAIKSIADDPRFTLIKNPMRLGAAGNWNKTLTFANSEYFKLLCADDVLAPNALEIQLAAISKNPDSVLCIGRRDITNSNGHVLIRNRGLRSRDSTMESKEALRRFVRAGTNIFGEPSFALFRTQALKDVGGFSKDWNYLIDVVSYLDVLNLGSLVVVDANLGKFRVSSQSWSASLTKRQYSELLACINWATRLKYSAVSPLENYLGKIKARINTVARRLIFFFAS
jgi:glycosyltransferase involved in cell wall biosynthesis